MCAEAVIKGEHFHIPAHAEIYEVLLGLWDKGGAFDFIAITQSLRDRNKLEAVGGAGFITSLYTFLPTAANAAYYIDLLQEKYVLRQIIRVCTEYAARSYDEQGEVTSLLDKVEQEIFAISKDRYKEKGVTMKDMVRKAISDIEILHSNRGKIMGLETGFKQFDQMSDGLHGAEMMVVAARPSMGKTAFAMNIAEHMALNLGHAVAVFSLEMSAQQLVQRLLCSIAKVNMGNIRNGFMSERDFPNLAAAAKRLAAAKILIDDTSGLTIGELRAKARRMKAQSDIQAIFIDYLQLLRSP